MSIEFKGSYFGDSKFKNDFYSSKSTKKKSSKKEDLSFLKVSGSFKIKDLETEEVLSYVIGKNIYQDDELVSLIINVPKNATFRHPNGKKYILISRNLFGRLKHK